MNTIFELFGKIAIDNEDADRAIDKTIKKSDNAKSRMQVNFAKIGKVAATCGKALLTAGVAIGGALVSVANSTRDYRTEMGKLQTAFAMQNFSASAAKTTYRELVGVLGETDTAVEAAQHIAQLARNEQELNTWTNICTGVFATFGDSLPVESLMEASNETAKTGQVTGTLADALNWAGISETDFNKALSACSSESERQNLIMTTLNQTYGDAAKEYKKTNEEVIKSNQAHDKLNEALAGLGEAAEPAITRVIEAVAKLIEEVTPVIEAVCNAVIALMDAWGDLKAAMTNISATVTVHTNMQQMASAQMGDAVGEALGSSAAGDVAEAYFNATTVNPDNPMAAGAAGALLQLLGIGGPHANGLDRVPFDGYIAELHKGEAVLTAREAEIWRSGGYGTDTSRLESIMQQVLAGIQIIAGNTGAGQNIILDSGALVAQLTPGINAQMGAITKRRGRRS